MAGRKKEEGIRKYVEGSRKYEEVINSRQQIQVNFKRGLLAISFWLLANPPQLKPFFPQATFAKSKKNFTFIKERTQKF